MADHQTLSRLFLKQRETLLSYLRALVRNPDDAEDLFQEVGVKVLSLEALPCPAEKFPAWCRGVARNAVLHYWRSRRRDRLVLCDRLLDVLDLAYVEADAQTERFHLRTTALAACLEAMPRRQRQLIDLRYAQRRTSEQIGGLLDRSAGAIRQELMRLRSQLQECIQRRLRVEVGHDA